MDIQLLVDVLMRWIHVGTAIVLLGGSVYLRFVLMPAAAALSENEHGSLEESLGRRWKLYVSIGILLLLISGFYNFARSMTEHQGDGLYHALMGVKILLAFAVFFFASALSGRSQALAWVRENRARYLSLTILLAALVVAIAGFLKVRGG